VKTPLVMVDLFDGTDQRDAYMRRYQFVDWNRCTLVGNGFEPATLQDIF
jgi:hypothetical protein